jgi:hypothetical protein
MARRCRDVNFDVLNHPRVRRIYNDGREFILTTKNKYDLVISEPSNPYRAGVATLYTSEFYRAVRERLNPDGLFMQWVQAYEVDHPTVNTVVATARDVFPHVEVWQTLPNDLQLICSPTVLEYSTSQLEERIGRPTIKRALAESWKVYDLEGFLAHFMAGDGWADEVASRAGVPLNTDDRTILEYSFAKTVGQTRPFSVETVRKQLASSGFHQPRLQGKTIDWHAVEIRRQEFNLLFGAEPSAALLPGHDDVALVDAFTRYQTNDFAGVVKLWPAKYRPPADPIQSLLLARSYAELGRPECLELIASVEDQFPIEAAALNGIFYGQIGNATAAAQSLEQFYTLLAESPWVISVVAEGALVRTVQVAHADRDAARRFFQLLSRPLASDRYDYSRKLVRILVAEKLGPNEMVDALAEMEPHVRWTANVLKPRAEAYSTINHPLAERAQRDWEQFQRDQPND